MSVLLRYDSDDMPFSVVIDDDDRVAYAYLLDSERTSGDVWLYNRVPAPMKPEWDDPNRAPFLNPHEFALEQDASAPITDFTDVKVAWLKREDTLDKVEIFVHEELLAVLAPGAKPGWCRNARKTGPLAKLLEDRYASSSRIG